MTTPLLLVSGWAHPAGALQPLADLLARHRPVRVLAIHELGDGSSRSGYAAGLLRKLDPEGSPCILAGWSMGGMIALEAAAAQPDRVAALVMISSAPRLAAAPDFPAGVPPRILQSMLLSLRRAPERTLLDFFGNAAFPAPPDPSLVQARLKIALALNPQRLAAQLRYLVTADLREASRKLALPRLLLHGSLDRIIPVGAAAWMKAQGPDVQMLEWPEDGHSLPLQQPGRIAEHIVRFLEGAG